ncbi:MAG: thiamine-phosphate kinase [Deltaproteobacteria bacterium]|nr:thiamine-phosphate kinase [Deltaproteobacteria bacterium]
MTKIKGYGERAFIEKIARIFGENGANVVKGIGDDASVTLTPRSDYLVTTTDSLIEGIHFRREWTTGRLLGRKLVSISVSDIAAMGANPEFLLISIAVPENTDVEFLEDIYLGIKDVTSEFDFPLVGGNTAASTAHMMLTSTLLASADKQAIAYRNGALEGHDIYVSGTLGDSSLGLMALRQMGAAAAKDENYVDAVARHLAPSPRLRAGLELTKRGIASAMADISDGVFLDAWRIAEASNTGFEIDSDLLPLSAKARRHIEKHPDDAPDILRGGEDYELIFTASPDKKSDVAGLAAELKTPLTRIGTVTAKEKGAVITGASGNALKGAGIAGYEHFMPAKKDP